MANETNTNGREVVIRIRDLYKSFEDNAVLRGIDLDLYRGENVVVLGRSRSGKSVLIKIIIGLIPPDEGTVTVLGEEVVNLNKRDLQALRLKVGFLFQGNALYDSMTVQENLAFTLKRNKPHITSKQVDEDVNEVLEAVGLLQTINQYPSELSGGQKKRIGIARTLILRPEIILYDEPTAGLDPITSMDINHLINNVKERYKTSSIIITHDLTCAKITGDRVFMLVDGKFLRQGSFSDVFHTDDERVRGFYEYNFTQ
jgi:phospholipid/cholesterol/gamma-HCH transport system ATP-binding protein